MLNIPFFLLDLNHLGTDFVNIYLLIATVILLEKKAIDKSNFDD